MHASRLLARWFLIAAIVGLLSACVNRYTPALRHDLNTRAVCCKTFAEMPFAKLTTNESEITFDPHSPIFAFDEGRSYFAAFEIVDSGGPKAIVFRTYMDGVIMPDRTVFVPSIAVLDENRQVISVTRDVPLTLVDDHFVGHLEFPKAARYVVMYSFDAQHKPLFAYSENGSRWPVTPTMSGRVVVSMSR